MYESSKNTDSVTLDFQACNPSAKPARACTCTLPTAGCLSASFGRQRSHQWPSLAALLRLLGDDAGGGMSAAGFPAESALALAS